MNLYRGCTHGCIYCDSRSHCYRMEHDFEDVEVKVNAVELLEEALSRKRKPVMIGTGAMSDPYLPIEEKEELTRGCLAVIIRHGCGLSIQTKSARILRDMGYLIEIQAKAKCVVEMTLTTADEALCKIVEPNVSGTAERVKALAEFQKEGIPTVVWFSPILPYLNDTEENVRRILEACFDVGVKGILCFGMGMTLRPGSREYYYAKLDEYFPGLSDRYRKEYGSLYEVPSPRAEALYRLFQEACEKRGVLHKPQDVFGYLRAFKEKNEPEQMRLW